MELWFDLFEDLSTMAAFIYCVQKAAEDAIPEDIPYVDMTNFEAALLVSIFDYQNEQKMGKYLEKKLVDLFCAVRGPCDWPKTLSLQLICAQFIRNSQISLYQTMTKSKIHIRLSQLQTSLSLFVSSRPVNFDSPLHHYLQRAK